MILIIIIFMANSESEALMMYRLSKLSLVDNGHSRGSSSLQKQH